jgi:excinuclease UvrABC helicase subunit UvrB
VRWGFAAALKILAPFNRQAHGQPPYTLLDYFPKDFIMF